jgi:hypothetical protein
VVISLRAFLGLVGLSLLARLGPFGLFVLALILIFR